MTKKPLKFLPYGRQTIGQDDIDAVAEVLQSDFLTTGPKVKEFEDSLARKTGASEAVAVGNGTQALHLACLSADLGPGDAAIVPSLTFLATANAVRYCGADVIFADVDENTGIMQTSHLRDALQKNTDKKIKAVLPVHLGGQSANLKAIREIGNENNLRIIADACHTLGGTYKNSPIGSCTYEDMSVFSFHPVKNITMGEGGAITTNDKIIADQMRSMRSHSMVLKPEKGPWVYEMPQMGFNYRPTDIQCALGISQLQKLERFIQKRRELAALYDRFLAPLSPIVTPPARTSDCDPAWHLYAVRINFEAAGISRAELMNRLKEKGIGTQVHYIPVHTQPYYRDLYGEQDLVGTRKFYERTLSLPLFPTMEQQDIERVVEEISLLLR